MEKPDPHNTFNYSEEEAEQPHLTQALLPEDYEKHHFLIVNGKVKKISHSSAYILDMLTKDD